LASNGVLARLRHAMMTVSHNALLIRARFSTDCNAPRSARDGFGQSDEVFGITGDGIEAPRFPFGLGLLDALAARGDEVPPDVARPAHGLAANQYQAGGQRAGIVQHHRLARPKPQQLTGVEALAGDD